MGEYKLRTLVRYKKDPDTYYQYAVIGTPEKVISELQELSYKIRPQGYYMILREDESCRDCRYRWTEYLPEEWFTGEGDEVWFCACSHHNRSVKLDFWCLNYEKKEC
jgi:hypothetical protein